MELPPHFSCAEMGGSSCELVDFTMDLIEKDVRLSLTSFLLTICKTRAAYLLAELEGVARYPRYASKTSKPCLQSPKVRAWKETGTPQSMTCMLYFCQHVCDSSATTSVNATKLNGLELNVGDVYSIMCDESAQRTQHQRRWSKLAATTSELLNARP